MSEGLFTTHGDESVEARIVSWVLGEASAFEAAELERLCEERPELMVFKRRMLALHGLLIESETARPDDDKWKLPPEKRKTVDILFGEQNPIRLEVEKEKRIRHSGRRVLLAIAACVVITLFITRLQPWKQTSEAILEVKPRQAGMTPLGADMAESSGLMTPQFFGTEHEKVKSRESLEKVVDNLDLDKRWNMDKEDAVAKLKNSIKTENIRGTDMFKIQVRRSDKKEADEITREVAYAYKDYREQFENRDAERQLSELNKAVRDQEDKVEERRKVLSTIVRNKGIIYKGQDSFYEADESMAMRDERCDQAIKRGLDAQDYVDAKREFETDQQLLQTMKLKQMGETISRKIPSESVVVHEVPGSKSSTSETQALASNSLRTRRLETALPNELIEGTPKPMNVPNLETPVSGPAGSATWSSEESQLAQNEKRRGQVLPATTSPPMPLEAPASRSVMAVEDSSSLVLPDSAVAFGEMKVASDDLRSEAGSPVGGEMASRQPRPRIRPEPSKPVAEAAAASNADPFADEGGSTSGLAERQSVTKSGSAFLSYNSSGVITAGESNSIGNRGVSGLIEKDSINGNASSAEEKSSITEASEVPVLGDIAVIGKRFSQEEKSDLSWGSDYHDSKGGLSGTNTYSGGTTVTGGALGIGGSGGGGFAASDSDAKPKETGRGTDDSSLRSNHALTDGTSKKNEGRLVGGIEIVGGSKFELKPGNTSEYHLEGTHLAKEKAAAPDDADALVSGKPASVNSVVREFQYPTEYEPPALPNAAAADSFPKTPAAPTDFFDTSKIEIPPTNEGEEIRYKIDAVDKKTPQQKKAPNDGFKAQVVVKPDLTKLMEEIPASEDPYSTFSLNISDASFQIAQAALAKGERPDPAGIKVEQFYNAVDYGDPAPSANEPVAVNIEQSAHPVIPGRNLVRVALKTAAAGRSAAQPLRLTLLVDQSGSMVREDRRASMDKALAGLSELLTQNDLITVIGFSRTPRLLADGMTGDKAGKLADLVNQTASEGGTNLEEAIKLAEQMAGRQKLAGAQNRIVLFTDGAANLGNADPARLAEHVKQLRQKGIAFDIAGIAADGLNDELLGELARNGNGRYYVVGKGGDDNFAKQLAGAFRPAAENVKVQVRFNPERVGRYKLIGFEKDRLKTEDFRNDKVDAAELAAEEAGVAIYQVETLPEGNGELGEVSVRFRDTTRGEMVERAWTIPHDAAAPAIDHARPSMQLAVLAMLAGEKLKGGPLADAIDFKQFADSMAEVRHFYGGDGRVGGMLRVVDLLK